MLKLRIPSPLMMFELSGMRLGRWARRDGFRIYTSLSRLQWRRSSSHIWQIDIENYRWTTWIMKYTVWYIAKKKNDDISLHISLLGHCSNKVKPMPSLCMCRVILIFKEGNYFMFHVSWTIAIFKRNLH